LALLRVRYFHLPVEESQTLTGIMDGAALTPSLYWLGLPALGIAADVIGAHTGVAVRQRRSIMIAIAVFGLLSFGYYAVGMASLREIDFDSGLLVISLLLAPLPVLAVLGLCGDSLRRGTLKVSAALLASLLSGLLLLAATIISLLGLVEPIMGYLDELFPDSIDMTNSLVLNGTTFHEGVRALVVASAVLAIISGLHHWAPKLWGRTLAEPVGMLGVLLAAGGGVLWALGELAAGFADQPFYPTVADTTDAQKAFGFISAVGLLVLAGAVALLCLNIASVALGSKPAGSSQVAWSGLTLEWATASPPRPGNFPAPPIVTSATPLADGELAYDGLASESADGDVGEADPDGGNEDAASDGDDGEES